MIDKSKLAGSPNLPFTHWAPDHGGQAACGLTPNSTTPVLYIHAETARITCHSCIRIINNEFKQQEVQNNA